MKFVRPELLFLVWLLPLLGLVAAWGFRRRRRILSSFAADFLCRVIAPSQGRIGYAGRTMLVFAAMLLGVFALGGPQYGYRWQEVHRRGVDLIIALDCSRSMTAADVPPSRLERAKRKIADLLDMMTGDRVGLVAFAGTAFVQCPLTLDSSSFHLFLSTLSPEALPVGGTDLGQAVNVAIRAFGTESAADKAVILITDGESTGSDPLAAAEEARKDGVRLFCIGVGKADGAPIPRTGGFQKDSAGRIVMSRLDEPTLKKMAALTDGAYVRSVAGDMDLQALYQGQILRKMKRAELQSGRRKVWEDRYQWLLVPAVMLLIVEMLMPAAVRRRNSAAVAILVFAACLVFPVRVEAGWINRPLHKGADAYARGDYSAALKSFIDAQLQDPDRPEIDYDIGNTHYRLGDFDAAAQSYEAAARSEDPKIRQKALYNLGNALYRAGNLKGAVERYQKALGLQPGDADARHNLELAKKKLQEQKKSPPPPSSGQPPGKDNKKKGSGQEKAGKSDAGDKNGEKTGKGKTEAPKNNAGPAPSRTGTDKKDGKKEQGAGPPPEPRPDAGRARKADAGQGAGTASPSRVRAEQALNRLKDRPGRALMPAYGERRVEQDW